MTTSAPSAAEPSIQDAGYYAHVHEHAHLPATMPMGTTCAVHTHRAWEPIESHHVWPKGMGGPDVASNKISVCCNGHYAIHEYLRQLILHAGSVPWELAKHFSPKVRGYALRGWTEAGQPSHGPSGE